MKRNAQERHWKSWKRQNRLRSRDWGSCLKGKGQTRSWNWQNLKVFGAVRERDQRKWFADWEETERVLKLSRLDLKTCWWKGMT